MKQKLIKKLNQIENEENKQKNNNNYDINKYVINQQNITVNQFLVFEQRKDKNNFH